MHIKSFAAEQDLHGLPSSIQIMVYMARNNPLFIIQHGRLVYGKKTSRKMFFIVHSDNVMFDNNTVQSSPSNPKNLIELKASTFSGFTIFLFFSLFFVSITNVVYL